MTVELLAIANARIKELEEQFEALRYAAHHFVMHPEEEIAFDALVDALPPGVPNPANEPVALRYVYCKHCHKSHSVAVGEEECSPGAWIEGGEPWPTDSNQEGSHDA